ncbi:MAG: Carboxylesterase type [Gammaproteobacteria bacterium]|nr:Carboxylesterase type [Gammaproteobacteria bacterium]
MKKSQQNVVFVSRAPRNSIRRGLLLGSWLIAGVLSTSSAMAWDDEQREEGPVIKTVEGPVRGISRNGVYEFLGIPYAAAPVGDLRWMPPQPVKPWDGALDATHYAHTCAQVTEFGAFAGPSSTSEDCLYLNIFTTGVRGTKGALKPVLVWIHGGGNIDGESNDYNGSKLATAGPNGTPTVVVTINYRLGIFGFFSNSFINAEGHLWGNYGILDQQAALRWVQANIAAFGGDPNKVTLGGQSAGARDTTANLISPFSKGLFQRAILESYPEISWVTAAQMLPRGDSFAAAAGCSDAGCLRSLSAARILQLQGTPNANGPYAQQVFPDGTIVPLQPGDAWRTGQFHHMPIMAGLVHDEENFGLSIAEYFSGPPQVALTAAQYMANTPANVLAEYPLSNYGNDPQLAQDRVGTDPIACTTRRVAQLLAPQVPTYMYEFNYQNAPYYFPQMPNVSSPTGHFQPLAAHTIDIQFLFSGYHGGNLGVNLDQTTGEPRELQGKEITLSEQLIAAWTNFAATGDPNGSGNSPWPTFTPDSPVFFSENIPLSTLTGAQFSVNHHCAFWDPILPQ